MSDPLLTQCPHCETTFRITHEHLQIAGGAVRCGACYQVFHAGEHIVEASDAADEPVSGREPSTAFGTDDGFELDGLDDAAELQPPRMQRPAAAAANRSASAESGAGIGSLSMRAGDRFDDFDATDLDGMDDFGSSRLDDDDFGSVKPAKDSEDWARALLLELGEPLDDDDEEAPAPPPRNKSAASPVPAAPPQTRSQKPAVNSQANPLAPPGETGRFYASAPARIEDDLSDSFRTTSAQDIHDPFRMDGTAREDESIDDPEGWAKAILEEETDPHGGRSPRPAPGSQRASAGRDTPRPGERISDGDTERDRGRTAVPPRQPLAAEDDFLDGFDLADIEQDLDSPAGRPRGIEDIDLGDAASAMHTLELMPDEPRHKSRQGLIPPPVKTARQATPPLSAPRPRLERPAPGGRSVARALWMSGIVLILVVVGASLGMVNYHQWSREPALRPAYQAACNVLGCTLPRQNDTTLIQISRTMVRPHPTIPGALSLDTLIINEASYAQPFPLLEVTLEDINGNSVARNAFRPEQYIRDPGIDLRRMLPRTPYHVGLELQKPAQYAPNWDVRPLPLPEQAP